MGVIYYTISYENAIVEFVSIFSAFSITVILLIVFCRIINKTPKVAAPALSNESSQNNNIPRYTRISDEIDARMHAVSPLPNIRRWYPDTLVTKIFREQRRLDNLQIEQERNAYTPLVNNHIGIVTNERQKDYGHAFPNTPQEQLTPEFNILSPTFLPHYVSQDDELPSYAEAIAASTTSV